MIYIISLFFLLLSPLLFQLIFGIKAIKDSISLSFLEVILISSLGHVAFAIINLELMGESLKHATHKCGMAWLAVLMMEYLVGFVLLIVILIQLYIQYRKNKSNEEGNAN
ncbi:hypothetical protein EOD40_07095 [Flavobacterium sufflavum]|uniref:Uncharacterized protein n=1 Tax=Flavobacterium sufflavum TaxID=1921138 RepID=A0A3S2UQG3_9FLAO|nr:hypothetical protein [Flavobacterium sufflavum]RVT77562.1 hypothetical protein EOD40_07095 [Flavobacterium sufflavum]